MRTVKFYDVEDVRVGINVLVEANPDFVYVAPVESMGGACVYRGPDGKGSCLVGQWMESEGIELPRWEDHLNKSGAYSDEFYSYLKGHGMKLTETAQNFLATLQCHQDTGHTWADALDQAAQAYPVEPPNSY